MLSLLWNSLVCTNCFCFMSLSLKVWGSDLTMEILILLKFWHLKMIVYQNYNLPHTYGHRLGKKNTICDMMIINSLHGSKNYSNDI